MFSPLFQLLKEEESHFLFCYIRVSPALHFSISCLLYRLYRLACFHYNEYGPSLYKYKTEAQQNVEKVGLIDNNKVAHSETDVHIVE